MSKDPIPLDIRLHEAVQFLGTHWRAIATMILVLVVGTGGVVVYKYREKVAEQTFAEVFDEAMRAPDPVLALASLEEKYGSLTGGQWIKVARIASLAEKKEWKQASAEASRLAKTTRDTDMSVFALFLAAACARNSGAIDEAQGFLTRIIEGGQEAYVPLARLERARLLLDQSDALAAETELKALLGTLQDSQTPAQAAIMRRAEDILVWIGARKGNA